ncbi:thermonuclease family protein [Candidatus Daviesbacteria bacterium]|nr:thermonuclease family protein [Candidatus Daviesbacteria bacterium]
MVKCLPKSLLISFLVIITGFGFLWFGLQSTSKEPGLTFEVPQIETSPIATVSASENVIGIEGERVLVSKVVDGDTIQLTNGKTVRLIGIDTPETVDPRRPVGCFGKEASNEAKKLLAGKEVILQKDISETDKYKRLLRYIFLPLQNNQTLFVNDYLVREGFAKVLTYPPDVKYNEQLRQAEKEAREGNRGLWGRCY